MQKHNLTKSIPEKTLNKLKIEENFLNLIKRIHKKNLQLTSHNDEKLNNFPLR